MFNPFKPIVTHTLANAGIYVGGSVAANIEVVRNRFYRRAAIFGSLGVSDSYTDDDFRCHDLETFLETWMRYRQECRAGRLRASAKVAHDYAGAKSVPEWWIKFQLRHWNQQTLERAEKAITHHYDIGNELYVPQLGPTMAYSCGYWSGAKTLDDAQRNKYRHICEKLGLKAGMRVLEIGCGWGGFAAFAAKEYGVIVVGVSLSKEQITFIRTTYKELCVAGLIDLRLMDYRHIPKEFTQEFDAVVSIGMFEHVGPDNYDKYFRIAWGALKSDGLFLMHSIFGNGGIDPFIWYRIFPGGVLPTEEQVARAVKPYFVIENVENFGYDYYRTLTAWWENFKANWPQIQKDGRYDEKFYRKWEFYLKSCAVAFKIRRTNLNQYVLSKGGIEGGYQWNRPVYVK